MEAGEIPPDDVQHVLLRAVELCGAALGAAQHVFDAARALIGSSARSVQITDGEVAARAQVLLIEQHLGASATTLTPQH